MTRADASGTRSCSRPSRRGLGARAGVTVIAATPPGGILSVVRSPLLVLRCPFSVVRWSLSVLRWSLSVVVRGCSVGHCSPHGQRTTINDQRTANGQRLLNGRLRTPAAPGISSGHHDVAIHSSCGGSSRASHALREVGDALLASLGA